MGQRSFPFARWLDFPPISRVRRNHALEHATLHVLSERHPHLKLMGRSSLWGFYIYGSISAGEVLSAAQEALERLRSGQRSIAFHPQCGSNYVVAGGLAGLGAFLVLDGSPSRRETNFLKRLAYLPLVCAVATLGIILSGYVAPLFQSLVTTEANVGDLRIVGVLQEKKTGIPVYFVRTG
ncbi:MAG: DUF6391 domain-containing protein [Anaerolineae bacterium]|nr:DUF6391 domain-containing protein [Anaerolineae bacterium]